MHHTMETRTNLSVHITVNLKMSTKGSTLYHFSGNLFNLLSIITYINTILSAEVLQVWSEDYMPSHCVKECTELLFQSFAAINFHFRLYFWVILLFVTIYVKGKTCNWGFFTAIYSKTSALIFLSTLQF